MVMANWIVASPSLLGLNIRVAGTQLRNLRDLRSSCSLHLQRGIGLPLRRSSPRRSNSALAAVNPTTLRLFTRTNLVCNALQTDVLVEGSESKEAIEKLKVLVHLEGGNSEVADDQELLRFLGAKSFDIEQAAKAFTSHQKWREEFVPKGYFIEADLVAELESKKAYWINKDKNGRPVLLVTGRNHVYNKNDFDEFKRFVVYALDRVIREAPPGAEQFIFTVDLKGLSFKNLDSKSFIAAFEILQKHYPGRLDKVFMINVPLIFNGVWKIVKSFLDEDTRNKITFVDKKKLAETLTNDIDFEFLPKEYGGAADLVLLQDAVTPNWPPSS